MYLALALVYLGIAIAGQSVWALILLPVVLIVIQRGAIEPEEAFLEKRFGADAPAVAGWFRHWVMETFGPIETRLAGEKETGKFSHGDTPTLADVCLVPQCVNNARFDVDMTPYPTINRIYKACLELPAFADAMPMKQPDAE